MSADAEGSGGSYDAEVTVAGRGRSTDAGEISESIEVAGEQSSTTATVAPRSDAIDLYLTGDHNTVELRGYDQTVNFHHEGKHNTVAIAPKMSLNTASESGAHCSIEREEDLETDPDETELIRRTREEALSDLGLFGYGSITYQSRADDQNRCRYCGRDAEDIVHRHQERVLRVLGLTFTTESGDVSDECSYCTTKVDVGLDEDERRRIFD